MDSPIVIIWVSPLLFLGESGVGLNFYSLFEELQNFLYANRIATDGTPHNAASHLALFCLPMSHRKDARLI